MRRAWVVVLAGLVACGGGSEPKPTCAGCTFGTGTTTDSGTTSTPTGPATFLPGSLWWGSVSQLDGLGTYHFERLELDGQDCLVDYDVVAAISTNCPDCAFAWEMTLAGPIYVQDLGGCAGEDALDGATIRYGHVDPYSLLRDDDGWTEVGTDKFSSGTWIFQTFLQTR